MASANKPSANMPTRTYSRARSIRGHGLFLSASWLLNFSANIMTLSLKVLS